MDNGADQQLIIGLERFSGLLRAQTWKRRECSGLNPTQLAVLGHLAGHRRGLRLKSLAEALGVTTATLSESVSTLERRGELKRRPDPDDARAALITVTAAGRRSLARARSGDSATQQLVRVLGEQDRGALLRILQLLIHQAQQSGVASGFRTCLGCGHFQPYASGDAERPHLCGFLGTAFGHTELRVDCAEHDAASPESIQAAAAALRDPLPP
jgi:DNA-binding MarR family transcriptional regulator